MKIKNIVEIKNLQIELFKINYANNPNKLQSEIKDINKIHVVNKNLYEIN